MIMIMIVFFLRENCGEDNLNLFPEVGKYGYARPLRTKSQRKTSFTCKYGIEVTASPRAWLDSLLIAEETSYNRLTRYIGKLKDRTAIKGC